ncbi:unnamed protein product, partial [Polarella glacialis]
PWFAIFDLDGTLLEYEGKSHVALCEGLREARLGEEAVSWELHASIIGTRPETWSREILAKLGVPPEVLSAEAYVDAYHHSMERLYSDITTMPGANELVARLQELRVPMAIATSSVKSSFDVKMTYHPQLLEPMAAVVTGDDPAVLRGKPAPDIFLEAARRLRAEPSRCVVFEDSPHGIAAARAAGMFAVAIPDERLPGNDFSQADQVLATLAEWTKTLSATP